MGTFDDPDAAAAGGDNRKRDVRLSLVGLGLIAACEVVGQLLTASPLVLVAIAGGHVEMVTAAQTSPAVAVGVVVLVRRLFNAWVTYHLGRLFGPRVLLWVGARIPGSAPFMGAVERWFSRHPVPVLVLYPGTVPLVLAGHLRLRFVAIMAAVACGIAVRIALALRLAPVVTDPMNVALHFVIGNQRQITVLVVCLVVLYAHFQRRRQNRHGRGGDSAAALLPGLVGLADLDGTSPSRSSRA